MQRICCVLQYVIVDSAATAFEKSRRSIHKSAGSHVLPAGNFPDTGIFALYCDL